MKGITDVNRLQGLTDSRGPQGIAARGKNVYRAASMSPNNGPTKAAIARKLAPISRKIGPQQKSINSQRELTALRSVQALMGRRR